MTMWLRAALVVTCTVVLSSACAKKVPPPAQPAPPPSTQAAAPPPPPPPAPAPPPPPAPPPAPAALTEDEIFARKTLAELNAERPLLDALFDYDVWTIREDAGAVLQRNAEWLRRWPSTRILIEGHCDERGTAEYNLGLGDRRAASVKEYLVGLGIAPERITVVSMGKEAPQCTDTNEGCWQMNRRGHPIITAK